MSQTDDVRQTYTLIHMIAGPNLCYITRGVMLSKCTRDRKFSFLSIHAHTLLKIVTTVIRKPFKFILMPSLFEFDIIKLNQVDPEKITQIHFDLNKIVLFHVSAHNFILIHIYSYNLITKSLNRSAPPNLNCRTTSDQIYKKSDQI